MIISTFGMIVSLKAFGHMKEAIFKDSDRRVYVPLIDDCKNSTRSCSMQQIIMVETKPTVTNIYENHVVYNTMAGRTGNASP